MTGRTDETPPPLVTARLVREAFTRGALLGATLALTALVVFGLAAIIVPHMFKGGDVLLAVTGLFAFGFVATPLAIVEKVGARSRESYRRDVLVFAVSGFVSLVAGSVLVLQLLYAKSIIQDGASLDAARNALDEVSDTIKKTVDRPGDLMRLVILIGVPACPTIVGRLRGWDLGHQLGFVAGTTFAANFFVLLAWDQGKPGDIPLVAAVTALLAALTPILFRWADAAESLWARALGHEPD